MPPAPRFLALQTALAAVGFSSTIGQLVLLRELVAIFYGNELVFGLILAAWLAWVAVGAWSLPRLFPFRTPEQPEEVGRWPLDWLPWPPSYQPRWRWFGPVAP